MGELQNGMGLKFFNFYFFKRMVNQNDVERFWVCHLLFFFFFGVVNLSYRGFVSAGVGEDGCDGHGSCPVKDFF